MSSPRSLSIALLLSSDDSDSPHVAHDAPVDPARYLPEHRWQTVVLHKATAAREVAKLARGGFGVFVSLCDGAWDEGRAGPEVVRTLQEQELAYTGSGILTYDPSRTAMKMAAWSAGVAVPAFVVVEEEADMERAARLCFPLLVKHPRGYNSVGLTPASKVGDVAALRTQAGQAVEQ